MCEIAHSGDKHIFITFAVTETSWRRYRVSNPTEDKYGSEVSMCEVCLARLACLLYVAWCALVVFLVVHLFTQRASMFPKTRVALAKPESLSSIIQFALQTVVILIICAPCTGNKQADYLRSSSRSGPNRSGCSCGCLSRGANMA